MHETNLKHFLKQVNYTWERAENMSLKYSLALALDVNSGFALLGKTVTALNFMRISRQKF